MTACVTSATIISVITRAHQCTGSLHSPQTFINLYVCAGRAWEERNLNMNGHVCPPASGGWCSRWAPRSACGFHLQCLCLLCLPDQPKDETEKKLCSYNNAYWTWNRSEMMLKTVTPSMKNKNPLILKSLEMRPIRILAHLTFLDETTLTWPFWCYSKCVKPWVE